MKTPTMKTYRMMLMSSILLSCIALPIALTARSRTLLFMPLILLYLVDRKYLASSGVILAIVLICALPWLPSIAIVYREFILLYHRLIRKRVSTWRMT